MEWVIDSSIGEIEAQSLAPGHLLSKRRNERKEQESRKVMESKEKEARNA